MTLTITIPDSAYNGLRRNLGDAADNEIAAFVGEAITELIRQRLEERLVHNVTTEEFMAILDSAPDVKPPTEDQL